MKIAIIGFGAAAIGLLEKLKDSSHEIHVFEKSKDIYSSSISGIRADGKLFISNDMGGDIFIDMDLQKRIADMYLKHVDPKDIETGKSFIDSGYYKDFYKNGFLPVSASFFHIGTDQLKKVLLAIYERFLLNKNIHFHFNSPIDHISPMQNHCILNKTEKFEKVFVAVGRSGFSLVKKMITEHPQLAVDNTKVDLGVRYELPNHIVEKINREMYEFKLKYKSKTGYYVRTFCNNPSGFVVNENYEDFSTVNGHAKRSEKSTNTNFAILTTIKLTQPFNNPIDYGSYIAKLTNLLAGKNRVILQTYENLLVSKRTKNLYRVMPTLDNGKYILGDINLAYPRRIIESIVDFIQKLDEVIPGIANPDNLVYAPEIKFYSNKLDNNFFHNLRFIGDCSGHTRSIIYATAHGYQMADLV